MISRIIIALCLCCGFAQAQEKSIVQIGGIAAKISKSTSCGRDAWGKNDENACRCCITKHNYTGDSNQKTFAYCSQKIHCTEESLKNIADKAQLRQDPIDPDDFVTAVVKESHLLPIITLNEKELNKAGTKSGELNEDTAVYFLKVAASRNFITDYKEQLVRGDECVLAAKKKSTADTPQLFAIQIGQQCIPVEPNAPVVEQVNQGALGKTVFVLKEITKPIDESMNLTALRSDPRLSQYLDTADSHPTGLAIELSSHNLVYMFKDQPHFMSLLRVPPGKSISDQIKAWNKETNVLTGQVRASAADILRVKSHYQNIFCHAGKALGEFNKDKMVPQGAIFGTTIEHGALSADRYFIGDDPNHAGQYLSTMLDNQSMAASLEKTKPITGDLVSLAASSGAVMMDAITGNKPLAKRQWLDVFFEPFIRGYAGVNPVQKLGEVKSHLSDVFKTSDVWYQLKASGHAAKEWSDISTQMVNVINGLKADQHLKCE